ncbi:MAG: SusF/SusE family outer membrane protein [Bacteroidota bacterium]|nr:SusF/SusE family outer membrane protein [Bacteroidota bacterium]
MKKINILLVLLSMLGFYSCQDEMGVKINSKAETGTISFHLNQPQYANLTYVLENANANANMEDLTCVEPDYGFTAAVNYTTQVCFDSLFTAGTYQSLPTTVYGQKVNINTLEMDKAIIALYPGGSLPDPVVEKNVFVRLMAVVDTAKAKYSDSTPIVKPLYSNAIMLKILPYALPLFPYTETTPRLWFIVGLGNHWDNSVAGLGSSLIPLNLSDGKKYNLKGDGEFTYTGYFKASDGFKLVRDYTSSTPWAENWGMTGGVYTHNTGDNISVPADGYYTLTLNSIDNTLTIVSTSLTPDSYSSIGLVGAFNGWPKEGGDVVLTPNASTNNHLWYTTYTFAADSQCKLRANGTWDVNWGTPGADDGNPIYSAMGIGVKGNKNMIETAGTYTIIFNDISGCYYFIKK